jgi:hypothetical protein
MLQLLRTQKVDLIRLAPEVQLAMQDLVKHFNDSTPSLFHILYAYRGILTEGTRRGTRPGPILTIANLPEEEFRRLCEFGVVTFHPTMDFTLTEDGRQFLLRVNLAQNRGEMPHNGVTG